MLIVMTADATEADIQRVVETIEVLGYKPHAMPGANRTAVGITGNAGAVDPSPFADLPGVAECVRVTKPYKLISRELRPEKSVVKIGDAEIGGEDPAVIAGVCAVESYEQTMETAEVVAAAGCKLFRGGAFKPRTSPYVFQGLGEDGLKILAEVRDRFGLRIVTEAIDSSSVTPT
jgi:3-deoxy-7-phosphoheptulonate synthase